MIKIYKTKEEKIAAFKNSVALRKVWKDYTAGRISSKKFNEMGHKTIRIVE